jgi:7-cyano-7-deazaguanine synthase
VSGSRLLVLFSGGLDSAVLLHWARAKGPVATLTFDAPGRPRGERRAERRLLDAYGIRDRHRLAFPDGTASWVRGDRRRAYVPGRNLFFHASALLLAHRLGCRWVAAGHLATDAEAFPDARRSFFDRLEALDRAARRPGDRAVGILTPFLGWTKADVVREGRAGGVPLELSWSCYRDGPRPCGACTACRERGAALTSPGAPPRRAPRPPSTRGPPTGRAGGAAAPPAGRRAAGHAVRGRPRSSGSRRSSS